MTSPGEKLKINPITMNSKRTRIQVCKRIEQSLLINKIKCREAPKYHLKRIILAIQTYIGN